MADFTPTQGRYLAFIRAYADLHGYPPAESEIAAAMCVAPPSVNQMVKALEKKGLILRQPGKPCSLQVLVPPEEIPQWGNRESASRVTSQTHRPVSPAPTPAPSAKLYVFTVYLVGGPLTAKYANKLISRMIEIRGDQTLEHLHRAIFQAYDREKEHLHEFQLGKRPYDPAGPNYGIPDAPGKKSNYGDARITQLDDLKLTQYRTFGYWFDFGDDWYHQVQLERIEQAIPTVPYPRVISRVGKSPPQY